MDLCYYAVKQLQVPLKQDPTTHSQRNLLQALPIQILLKFNPVNLTSVDNQPARS